MEVRFLEKYKNLVFFEPDIECYFTVAPDNFEFWQGKVGGRHVISEPNDDDMDVEGFGMVLANTMIDKTRQADGVKIVCLDENQDETE